MRIALNQFAPEFPGRERNWDYIRRTAEATEADIVVFPELTSCGYMYSGRAEIRPYTDSRSILRTLEPIARQHKRLIVGGFAERDGKFLYNSAYVVGPDRNWVYRKIHLWNVENKIFQPGNQALTFRFQGHRIGIMVCYDLQFPELASYYARQGVELLLVPMSWAEESVAIGSALQIYNHMALTTAFSHGIYVGVSNRVGTERDALFPGQSSLTDPFGRILHLGSEEGTLLGPVDFSLRRKATHPSPHNNLATDPRLAISLPRPRATRRASQSARRRTRRPRR
jgi:predicted amidohydrolase